MRQRQASSTGTRLKLLLLATTVVMALSVDTRRVAAEPAAAKPSAAAPLAADAAAAPLVPFRRVFAPADRIRDWPRGQTKYIPIEALEFERLIKLTQDAGAVSELGSAQLVVAHYEAQLNEDDLLVGKFHWQVTHGAAEAALLAVDPCNLPIHDAVWDDGDDAVLGNGPEGRLGTARGACRPGARRVVDAWPALGRRLR